MLAVIHGVVMTVCCIAIMPVFLRMFTASEAVIELGVRYSAVAFAFTLIVTVSMAFEKLFQLNGIWLAFPVAETATLLVALVTMAWHRRKNIS